MMAAPVQAGERRQYWLSLAALMIALPVAIAVGSWDSVSEWRSRNIRTPLAVDRGATQRYAGAQWQLTGLTRLPASSANTALVVAEFEATVDEPRFLRDGLCQVVLEDDKGRRWQPAFIPGRAVRQVRPAAADKPRCTAIAKAEKGRTIAMAESFTIPTSATGLTLAVTVAGARPEYLVFK